MLSVGGMKADCSGDVLWNRNLTFGATFVKPSVETREHGSDIRNTEKGTLNVVLAYDAQSHVCPPYYCRYRRIQQILVQGGYLEGAIVGSFTIAQPPKIATSCTYLGSFVKNSLGYSADALL